MKKFKSFYTPFVVAEKFIFKLKTELVKNLILTTKFPFRFKRIPHFENDCKRLRV